MFHRSSFGQAQGKSRPGSGSHRRKGTRLQNGGYRSDSTDESVEDFGQAGDPYDKSSVLEKRESVRGSLALAIVLLSAIAFVAALVIDLYRGTWQAVVAVASTVVPMVSAVVYHYFTKKH